MAKAVVKFQEHRRQQDAQRLQEKLEKELQGKEVSTITRHLRRLREISTIEDDVYTFTTLATNFRSLLLRLLRGSVQRQEYTSDHVTAPSMGGSDFQDREMVARQHTQECRERLLEKTASDMDAAAGRLAASLESEVLPWLSGLSRHEKQLLHTFVPGLQSLVTHLLEQLRVRARLTRFLRHLWVEGVDDRGSYQCMPVGLLMHRTIEAPMDVVQRARLEALKLLWASGTSAGQSAAPASNSGNGVVRREGHIFGSMALRVMLQDEGAVKQDRELLPTVRRLRETL